MFQKRQLGTYSVSFDILEFLEKLYASRFAGADVAFDGDPEGSSSPHTASVCDHWQNILDVRHFCSRFTLDFGLGEIIILWQVVPIDFMFLETMLIVVINVAESGSLSFCNRARLLIISFCR